MAVPVLSSRIDRSDDRVRQNAVAFDAMVADLRAELAAVRLRGCRASTSSIPLVSPGESVTVGRPVIVVEAMKMEHTLRASTYRVVLNQLLAVIDPAPTSEEGDGLRPVS